MRTVEVTPSRRQPSPQRPSIRVRPAPPSDPPYDDEIEAWASPSHLAGQLALPWSFGPATDAPPAGTDTPPAGTAAWAASGTAVGADAAHGRAAGGRAAGSGATDIGPEADGPEHGRARFQAGAVPPRPVVAPEQGRAGFRAGTVAPRPVVTGASAAARLAVRRFVGVLVEVLNGYRPPAHLRPLCRPVEATEIIAQARAAMHRMAESRRASSRPPGNGPRPTSPATRNVHRAADRHGRRPDSAAVLRLRLCEPRPGSVEATVVLVTGARTWALALRLDGGPDAWAATVARIL